MTISQHDFVRAAIRDHVASLKKDLRAVNDSVTH